MTRARGALRARARGRLARVEDLRVSESVLIPAGELSWTAVRSGGPGGQNVNKVSSKIDLRFDLPASTALSAEVKTRLGVLCKNQLDAQGRVIIVSQQTRDREQNLSLAREKLAELVRAAMVKPKARKKTKPSRGATERRLAGKKADSQKKAERSKGRGDE